MTGQGRKTGGSSMGRHFPGLSGKATDKERRPLSSLRICIATPDIAGLTRNGGIGSTYANLASTLAAAGHEVTILYLLSSCEPGMNEESAIDSYKKKGIRLLLLPGEEPSRIIATEVASISYLAYRWLKQRDFDVIHFPEWMGLGYYSVLAKHQGLAFLDCTMVVGLHSPTIWFTQADLDFYSNVDCLERDFMERRSVAYSDVLFSPTQYMISWAAGQGWELPARSYVQPHILPDEFIEEAGPEPVKIKELVFFGRLEILKGLVLFCDALDLIAKNGKVTPVPVTFLGKQTTLEGITSKEYILERARQWPFAVRIISDLDRDGALAYLKEGARLAIIASLAENFANTVQECCGMGIPFLASAVGGIPERINPEDRESTCFVPRPGNLAKRLVQALEEGVPRTRSAVDFKANRKIWTDWYEPPEKNQSLPGAKGNGTCDRPSSHPLVSVCLTTFNRPHLLAQALESLRSQDYPNFEVLLVDDGSDQPEALAFLDQLEPEFKAGGWRIIRQENSYLGAARNTGARHAHGEYLLFMDDDNYAEPHEISTFVRVAGYCGADILTCIFKIFNGNAAPSSYLQVPHHVSLPLGAAADVGAVKNCFGDANALVRRSTFEELGGFTEDYGVGTEDHEFFARAVLKGARLEVVPEELFWYRRQQGSMIQATPPAANVFRSARPYLEALSPDLRGIVRLLQGYHEVARKDQFSRRFETLWNSWSWRSFRPIRNFIRRCRRLPPERKPKINSIYEAEKAIKLIKNSATWHITRPLRALRKLVKRCFPS
jgi:glycosyltransferase involved in cell wall biosynthesis